MSMESIHGPGVAPPTMPPMRPAHAPEQDAHAPGANGGATSLPYAPSDPTTRTPGTVDVPAAEPVDAAPAGVDPEVWSVLTAEEREFFAVAREMGPITYGRRQEAANDTVLPRGRRLDVRV